LGEERERGVPSHYRGQEEEEEEEDEESKRATQ
jgi:hypothetical protein